MNEQYQKGVKSLEDGKMREAEEAFLECLSANPEHALAHNKLGLVYARVEDYKRAKEHLQEALERDPVLVQAWNNLGNIARQEGALEQARTYYQKALEVEPDNSIPKRNLRAVERQLKWTPKFMLFLRQKRSDRS